MIGSVTPDDPPRADLARGVPSSEAAVRHGQRCRSELAGPRAAAPGVGPVRASVVLPTHDRPALLAEAVASVAAQTFADRELLVVDDGSDPPVDGPTLAARFGPWVRVLRHERGRGGPAAKNTGAAAARGEVLAFLDDDDLYAPTYLERAVGALDRHPALDAVFMGVAWFGERAEQGQTDYEQALAKTLAEAAGQEVEPGLLVFGEALLPALLKRVPMAFQRPVVRRAAFERLGGYREGVLLWDGDWALRAAMTLNTGLLTEGLYRQRAAGQGYSSRADRRLEHLLSSLEIRRHLLETARAGRANRQRTVLLRQAVARSSFHLAFHHAAEGAPGPALRAWLASQQAWPDLGRVRFLARLASRVWSRQPVATDGPI